MAQRIYIASDQLLVSHLFTLLERAGISALMQKAVVDVPQEESGPLAWYSELWILQDGQLAKAGHLLEQALAGEMSGEMSGGAIPELAGWPHKAAGYSSSSSSSSSSSPSAGIA